LRRGHPHARTLRRPAEPTKRYADNARRGHLSPIAGKLSV
jgi:hypothetical protein